MTLTIGSRASTIVDTTEINYITNGGFEATNSASLPSGWATYADAAGTDPVDGTGGSANITFQGNTSSPLRGVVDAVLTKGAANRQGEGVAYDFTIDPADKAKMLAVSFDYSASANFDYGTNGDATDPSDVTVWVYDKDDTNLIQPAPYTLDGSGTFYGVFQTHATSDDYRLILHISGTNASAWTLNIDNVQVGPQDKARSNALWPQYVHGTDITLTTSGLTGVTFDRGVVIPYQTSGGTWRMKGNIALDHDGSTDHNLVFPSTTTMKTGYNQACSSVGSSNKQKRAQAVSGTNYISLSFDSAVTFSSVSFDVELDSKPTWATKETPLISADADTRVVAMEARDDAPATAGAITSWTNLEFNDPSINDTHSSYNSTTGSYTIPVSGWYSVTGNVRIDDVGTASAGEYVAMAIAVDTSKVRERYVYSGGGESSLYANITAVLKLDAGQVVNWQVRSNLGSASFSTALNQNFKSIHRLSGPSQIAASEVVAARYTSNTGQVMSNTGEIADFEDVDYDTHGAVTTGASWKFTAPISGHYSVKSSALISSRSYTNGQYISIRLRKNGSYHTVIRRWESPDAGYTGYVHLNGSTDVFLNSGEYIDLYYLGDVDGTRTTDATYNNISIHRIGGVM